MGNKIIAVDFDGTLCENAWPNIGAPRKAVIDYVCEQQRQGAKLILWTNRSGSYLDCAVRWCGHHGIVFDAVNENLPEMIEYFQNDCRKVFANEYIDDRAIPMPGEPQDVDLTEIAKTVYTIRERLGTPELLTQLAEECAELAQAALKHRRALTGDNPTPVSAATTAQNLVEEMADVELCASMLSTPEDNERKREIRQAKATRWLRRMLEAGLV